VPIKPSTADPGSYFKGEGQIEKTYRAIHKPMRKY